MECADPRHEADQYLQRKGVARRMKKWSLSIIIICLIAMHISCGKDSAAQTNIDAARKFDFTRYGNQPKEVFLEDYGLSMDDFDMDAPTNYLSRTELPFLDTMATYRLILDAEDRIMVISPSFLREDGLDADFDRISMLRDLYNGSEGVIYMYDLEEYEGVPNINTYKTADEFKAAVMQVKANPQKAEEKHWFQLGGRWNRKDHVQVAMHYVFRFEDERSRIELEFCNIDSPAAVPFDHIAPEGTSIFKLP